MLNEPDIAIPCNFDWFAIRRDILTFHECATLETTKKQDN